MQVLGSSGEGVYIKRQQTGLVLHNVDNLVNDYSTDHPCKKTTQTRK